MRVGILEVYRICSTHAPIQRIPLVLSPVRIYWLLILHVVYTSTKFPSMASMSIPM